MSEYWKNKQKRLKELSKLRAEGYTWAECAKETGYEKSVTTLRTQYGAYDTEDYEEHAVRNLQQKHRAAKTARLLRKDLKTALEFANHLEDVLAEVKTKFKANKVSVNTIKFNKKKKGTPMICEALISDIQMGKVTPDFNTDIAIKRLKKHGESLLFKIKQHADNGYKFEKIILAFLGDIIESSDKASKKGTPLSVDSYTTEQIVTSTKYIFKYIIAPLAELGIPVEVVGVPGNHDNRNNGMPMDKAGVISDTWLIYNFLEMLSEGYKNVKFNITKGFYATAEVFGNGIVYEHGYGIPVTEAAMLNRLNQRIRQEKQHITYFRMGDKHNISRFNEDQLVVNGAYFGLASDDKGEDYSSASGFEARAGQIAFFHVPRKDNRLPCYDSFIIQLSHIK